jgi:hypothetical protein
VLFWYSWRFVNPSLSGSPPGSFDRLVKKAISQPKIFSGVVYERNALLKLQSAFPTNPITKATLRTKVS